MSELRDPIDRLAAETAFSGVVRVDVGDEVVLASAYGLADRAHAIANTPDTRFGIASGTKGFTALTVMALVQDGTLSLETTARETLGTDLPLIADDVTVEHLLAHRSGIGDYFDEDIERPITDHVVTIPAHELDTIEAHLPALDGFPTKFPAGERFSYCNGGFVVLALMAERSASVPFHDLVAERVFAPAGMPGTGFPRSDEPAGDLAIGYLDEDGPRTNIFHLPVRGGGDGGAVSNAVDIRRLWVAMFEGRILPTERITEMVRPHSDAPDHEARYGLGFWLHETRDLVELHGYDAGVSFRSVHDPASNTSYTVISNTAEGAWPISERLDELMLG